MRKYGYRLITLIPLMIITGIYWFRKSYEAGKCWMLYGGEFIIYNPSTKNTIADLLFEKKGGDITKELLIKNNFVKSVGDINVWKYREYSVHHSPISKSIYFFGAAHEIRDQIQLNSMMNIVDSLVDAGVNESPWVIRE